MGISLMLLKALKDLPTHREGDVFDEPDPVAHVLVAVGGALPVIETRQSTADDIEPDDTEVESAGGPTSSRRRYRRRDLRAED